MRAQLLGESYLAPSAVGVWKELASAMPLFSGVSLEKLPPQGKALDGSAFQHLNFPETGSLHAKYEPQTL
jgi:hypothetical protein